MTTEDENRPAAKLKTAKRKDTPGTSTTAPATEPTPTTEITMPSPIAYNPTDLGARVPTPVPLTPPATSPP